MGDGQSVAYNGSGDQLLRPGDEGIALIAEAAYAHVLWRTGARAGETGLYTWEDLAPVRGHIEASLDDSLEVESSFSVTSTRDVFDEDGIAGVLEQMAFTGRLSALRDVAEEGFALVASRVRTSPEMRHIAAQLDEGEAEALVQATSATLLRELLSSDE